MQLPSTLSLFYSVPVLYLFRVVLELEATSTVYSFFILIESRYIIAVRRALEMNVSFHVYIENDLIYIADRFPLL